MKRSCLFLIFVYSSLLSHSQNINDVWNRLDSIQTSLDSLTTDDKKELLFSVGSNVNFISEARLQGLYYDISVFKPKLFEKTTALKRIGIDARIAQGRLDIHNDTLSTIFQRNVQLSDTTGVRQRYRRSEKTQANYLNISISPMVSIGQDENLYGVLYFEYFRRKNINEFSTFIINQDTFDTSSNDRFATSPIENRTVEVDEEFDLFNYGAGLHLRTKVGKNVVLHIRPIIGAGVVDGEVSFFYHTQFEAIEMKHGFKFGGEIRGFAGKNDNPSLDQFYKPFVNFFVAKTFSFQTLGTFLLGG